MKYPKPIENCGYYKLEPELLTEIINETIKRYGNDNGISDIWDNNYEALTKNPSDVVYHEWY